jgi:hypothetical protein
VVPWQLPGRISKGDADMLNSKYLILFVALFFLNHAYSQEQPQGITIDTDNNVEGIPSDAYTSYGIGYSALNDFSFPPFVDAINAEIERQREAERAANEASEFWTILGHRIKITDSLLVVLVCLLFLATIGLYCAVRNLVRGSKDTAKRQLRAYLSAAPDSIRPDFGMKFRIENHGLTPAYRVAAISAAVDIFPYPLPANHDFKEISKTDEPAYVLAPREVMNMGAGPNRTFSAEEIDHAINGITYRFYMYGTVEYVDAFKDRHVTAFCRSIVGGENLRTIFQPQAIHHVKRTNLEYETTGQHNHAD